MSVRWFEAVKTDGKAQFASDAEMAIYRAHLSQFGDGEELQLAVRKRPRKQGYSAMRYYRGVVVVDICCGTGELPTPENCESIHDALAWKFLRIADDPKFGTPRRRSTSKDDMSADEMSKYIDDCKLYGRMELLCEIREPGDVDWDHVPSETAA